MIKRLFDKILTIFILITVLSACFNSVLNINISVATEKDTEYLVLIEKLEKVLKSKNYGEEQNKLIKGSFDKAYYNYDDLYSAFKFLGYPSKTEYMTNNFIKLLEDNIDSIELLDYDNPQEQEYFASIVGEGYASAVYLKDLRKFIAFRLHESSMYPLFFHEIFHSAQQYIIEKYANYQDLYLWYIFVEGEAINRSTIVEGDYIFWLSPKGSVGLKDANKENYFLQIEGYGSMQQALYENFFMKLQMLVGYRAVEQFHKDGDINKIKTLIDAKYGDGTAEQILECMKDVTINVSKGITGGQEDFNSVIKLENIMFKCIKSDISNIKTKTEAKEYFNFYRIYKLIYLTKYIEDTSKNNERIIVDYTEEKFDLSSLENELIDKCLSYNVFHKFSNNDVLNRNAIKSLFLYTYKIMGTPFNLYDVKYTYTEKDQTGYIMLYTRDGIFKLNFDTQGNMKIEMGEDEGNVQKLSLFTEGNKGDINKDGKVDVLDLLAVKRHILSTNKPEWKLTGDSFISADINGDGKIDVLDLLEVKRMVLKNVIY